MDDGNSLPFSAFLAGALLANSRISKIDLVNSMCKFEDDSNTYIDNRGLDEIKEVVEEDNNDFYLKFKYTDIYRNICTVEEYLYSMTTPEIRIFFNLNENKEISSGVLKRTGIFRKIRTRVFH